LVGVTHECDFPADVCRIPKITRSLIPAGASSLEIDSQVSATLQSEGSLYELDLELLETLAPDLILTQRLCDVCAVSYDRVQQAAERLPSRPRVMNLEPRSLEDVFECIRTVAAAIGSEPAANALLSSLNRRVAAVRDAAKNAPRPKVFCMEWVHPPYCGGHWMKELVEAAGGRDDMAIAHRPSRRIDWNRVLDFAPEVIVLTCCGFDLRRTEQEGKILATFDEALNLPAFRSRRVFATDGSHFFSRPGPRLVESLEILSHLIHPELFSAPPLPDAYSVLARMS
jgi:iron complex transport system substrate-binding protein